MDAAEITLAVITAVLFGSAVLGAILSLTIKFFRAHKRATTFFSLALFCCGAATLFALLVMTADIDDNTAAQIVAAVLLGFSAALAVIALGIVFGLIQIGQRHKISWLTAAVVLIVMLLQVAVNIAYPYDFSKPEGELGVGVLFARVISSAFQYFSLDASYVDIIGAGEAAFKSAPSVYAFYTLACAMTVIAPIVGGFAIFGVLGHFFPRIALWRNTKPTKYVFSELNEYSIETAESIVTLKTELGADKKKREAYIARNGEQAYRELMRSVIIFTDVYSDNSSELDTELLSRAHDINAICLKDDILTRKIYWIFGGRRKKVVYFLMDKSDFYTEKGEENNLQTAVSLFAIDGKKMMWAKTRWWQLWTKANSMEVFVFSRSENTDDIIDGAYNKWLDCYVEGKPPLMQMLRERDELEKAIAAGSNPSELNKRYAAICMRINEARLKLKTELSESVVYKTINEYENLVYGLISGTDGAAKVSAYPLYRGLEREDGRYDTRKLSILVVGGGRIAKAFIKSAYWCGQMLDGDVPSMLRLAVLSMDAEKTEERLKAEMPEAFIPELCDYEKNKNSYCEFEFVTAEYGTEKFLSELERIVDGRIWSDRQKRDKASPSSGAVDVDYILVALGADNLNMQAADWLRREIDRRVISGKVVPVNYVIENNALCQALKDAEVKRRDEATRSCCLLNPFGALCEQFSFENLIMTELEREAYKVAEAYAGDKVRARIPMRAYDRNSSIASAMHSPYRKRCIADDEDAVRHAYVLEHRRWCAYMRSTGFRQYTAVEFARLCKTKQTADGFSHIVAKNLELKLHACILESSDRLTDAEHIRKFLDEHPRFFDVLNGVLDELRSGKTLYVGSRGNGKRVLETVPDLCDYLRGELKCKPDELDDLDIFSAVASSVKIENGKPIFKAHNYKDYDIKVAYERYGK